MIPRGLGGLATSGASRKIGDRTSMTVIITSSVRVLIKTRTGKLRRSMFIEPPNIGINPQIDKTSTVFNRAYQSPSECSLRGCAQQWCMSCSVCWMAITTGPLGLHASSCCTIEDESKYLLHCSLAIGLLSNQSTLNLFSNLRQQTEFSLFLFLNCL